MPPRHGKTETFVNFYPWALLQRPDLTHAYASYALGLSAEKSRRSLRVSTSCGLELSSRRIFDWQTPHGGGTLVTSVNGQLTGRGITGLGLVDDPVKRAQAESAVIRESIYEWFQSDFMSCIEPGASVVVCMTRWHPDDLSGRLIKKQGSRWKVINLPALSEDAEERPALAGPVDAGAAARAARRGRRVHLGQPLPGTPAAARGLRLRGPAYFWTQLPRHFRVGRGCDLAYTAKTSADASVLVTLLHGSDGYYYVLDVKREQVRAPGFVEVIKRGVRKFASSTPIWFYGAGGPESGAADLIKALGLRQLRHIPAVADKFVRAGPLAAAWNAGKVLVPADSERFEWVDDFVEEFVNFTGTPGGMDDRVDATVGAFDSLAAALDDGDIKGPKAAKRTGLAAIPM